MEHFNAGDYYSIAGGTYRIDTYYICKHSLRRDHSIFGNSSPLDIYKWLNGKDTNCIEFLPAGYIIAVRANGMVRNTEKVHK